VHFWFPGLNLSPLL